MFALGRNGILGHAPRRVVPSTFGPGSFSGLKKTMAHHSAGAHICGTPPRGLPTRAGTCARQAPSLRKLLHAGAPRRGASTFTRSFPGHPVWRVGFRAQCGVAGRHDPGLPLHRISEPFRRAQWIALPGGQAPLGVRQNRVWHSSGGLSDDERGLVMAVPSAQ